MVGLCGLFLSLGRREDWEDQIIGFLIVGIERWNLCGIFLGVLVWFLWVFEFYGNWLLGGSVKLLVFVSVF